MELLATVDWLIEKEHRKRRRPGFVQACRIGPRGPLLPSASCACSMIDSSDWRSTSWHCL
jgi:hypothetical protein